MRISSMAAQWSVFYGQFLWANGLIVVSPLLVRDNGPWNTLQVCTLTYLHSTSNEKGIDFICILIISVTPVVTTTLEGLPLMVTLVLILVIALFFTIILRPFSQPCHPHARSPLSLFPCYLRLSTLLSHYQLAIRLTTLTNSYDLMTIPFALFLFFIHTLSFDEMRTW